MSSSGYNQYSAAQYAGYRVETDFAYLCTAKWASEYFSVSPAHETQTSPVWELQFAYGFDSRGGQEDSTTVTHGAELAFVFPRSTTSAGSTDGTDLTEPQQLADIVVAYWTNFAKTGDPNGLSDIGQQLPDWPQTRGTSTSGNPGERDLVLSVRGAEPGDIVVLDAYHSAPCDYWRAHWQPWDRLTCADQCFGGCIPCPDDNGQPPRLDFSQYGEVPSGGAC